MKPLIQAGTVVKWRRGNDPWKEGEVLAFIPKCQQPHKVYPLLTSIPASQCKMGYGRTGASNADRYLIRVDRIGAKGQPLKPLYFAPTAATIDRCTQS